MEYTGMQIPFELVPFEEMNKKQAEQYFNWFMETKEERLQNLQRYISRDTKEVLLDKTPNSLIGLWKWFQAKIIWEEKTKEELQTELAERPEWMKKHIIESTQKLSLVTRIIAFDISVYFGEVMVCNNDSLYWGYKMKPKKLDGVNRPIIMGFVGEQCFLPYTLIEVCIRKTTRCPNDSQLFDLYHVWYQSV